MEKHPLRVFKETSNDIEQLKKILADNIVFSSPILSRQLEGKDLVALVMTTSTSIREGKFTHEFRQGNNTVLIWEGIIAGHHLTSFELLEDDQEGKLKHRTVALRPFPVVEIFRNAMYEKLKGVLPDDMWHLQVDAENREVI